MLVRRKAIYYVFALLIFSGCLSNKKQAEQRTVFRYNEPAGITSLDPAYAKDQPNIWAVNQLFNGLVQLDDSLNIQPCIAKSWDISEGGRKYTFHLRNDVFFHAHPLFSEGKGQKVVASDFVFSFNRIVDESIASPGSWIFDKVLSNDNRFAFSAENDSTLTITLKETFPPFLGLLTMQYCSVVPREIVGNYGKDFRKNPIGTGPFVFKMWKEGAKLVLRKNPAYFEFENGTRLPFLDAIAINFIIDRETAFLEFVKGNLDFLSGIDASYKDELLAKNGNLNPKYKDRFYKIGQPYLNTEYLGFLVDESIPDVKNSPLRLKKVRQAINYGFDREKMIKYLRNNVGTPGIYGFVPPSMLGFSGRHTPGYDYNPDFARKLLVEAGFPGGEGLPEITLNTTASYLDLCKYIQNQLGQVGIKIKIDVTPWATHKEMMAQSKILFFRGSWIADYPDAENYLSLFYSKNYSPAGPNYTHFSSPQYDRLLEKAAKELNDNIRFGYYKELDSLLMDDAPVVILYYDHVLRFVSNEITGLNSNPMNLLTLKRVKKVN